MIPSKIPVYQTTQIRELERLAIERFGIAADALMARAGRAAFDYMLRRWSHAQKIAIFCGSGNNGGDGYVMARLAHERSLKVTVYQVGDHTNMREEAAHAKKQCEQAGVKLLPYNESVVENPDLVVDAICGIGLKDDLRDDIVAVIDKMHRLKAPIFSLDVPTGVDADSGRMLGSSVHAEATITFIGLKLGLLTGSGPSYTGELVFNDLQLPPEAYELVEPAAEKIGLNSFVNYLKPRLRDWHKGLSGHVLIIGGDQGYAGAPHMAAEAALRVGAGLVSVATRVENAALMNVGRPEIMSHGIETASQLLPLIDKAKVIVLGPGLGQSEWAKMLWKHACQQDLPLVVDADGLNILSGTKLKQDNWVLTPHPGEAAQLLNKPTMDIQHDRLGAVKEIHQRYGGVCVLKGVGSLILAPDTLPALCDKGNPGMSSAGMGDILSGVIGGLIAQGVPMGDAAKLGVCLHAMAGDMAAKEGERGTIATDLLPFLRRLSNIY